MIRNQEERAEVSGSTVTKGVRGKSPASGLTSEQVWRSIAKASFAVLSYVTPGGEPRSSGVVYKAVGRKLYVAVSPESWKARHVPFSGQVSVTVPVRRGGLLALVLPIPPATISFHATAIVDPAGSAAARSPSEELKALLPPERRASSAVIEISPTGTFLTYGLGIPLMKMRDPASARARVPVADDLV